MTEVLDMRGVIVPKSDQINADDLISGPLTITIREVHIRGGQEQPVSIYFDGSEKAFRPCKSMSRVLVAAWGPDAKAYVGRSLTVYRDPEVKWAGMAVGGIRISHMSHIDGKMTMALTATKGQRKPHVVMPLVADVKQHPTNQRQTAEQWAAEHIAAVQDAPDVASLDALIAKAAKPMGKLSADKPDLAEQVAAAYDARRGQLVQEGKPATEQGKGFAEDGEWQE